MATHALNGGNTQFPLVVLVMSGCLALLMPQSLAAAEAIDPQRMASVDEAINQAIQRGDIPGAVLLVGRDNATVYQKAYGNRALQPAAAAMTTDTIFDLASLSKPVGCASSIMLLAERGKVTLADPVGKYIPAFTSNGKEQITIEQLLLHQGGLIPDNPMSDYRDGATAALANVFALKPLKAPGQGFWYSDVGYIVLGQIVRAVDGRPLDQFAREEIFQPAGMNDTAYNPPDAWKARCAPTEKREGRWMIGQVHDPRSYALGGVAGHAGVFSTAADLARFCRMILGDGQIDGKRVLAEQTVRRMIQPRSLPDGTNWRTYGFDVDTAYSSCRGDRFERGVTFGHSGFTGTSIWLDPKHNCFVILLTNSVHPDGKGSVLPLRRRVATLVAQAMLGLGAGSSVAGVLGSLAQPPKNAEVLCGIDVLKRDGFKLLDGRRVAIITNHSGRDRQGNRTVDLLASAKNLAIVKLWSPEHGLYGMLDEKVANTVDQKTGLKVYSLYGQTLRPTAEMLEGADTIVYDIQDVGARFYTYISTLGYCMEAAAKNKLRMVVLDRPNPITGLLVDGPVADKESLGFTAYSPMPVAHGMTIGELALYYNKEMAINCDLQVIQMQGWDRAMWFDETGLMWVNPSPNMRNLTQSLLYPGVCLLEACNISVGRGTDQPFETFGAPWIDGPKLAAALNGANLPGLRFVPVEFTPKSSKFANKSCQGVYIIVTDRNAVEPVRAGLVMAWQLKKLFGDSFQFTLVNRLLVSSQTLKALGESSNPATVPATWKAPLEQFKDAREKYLIYK